MTIDELAQEIRRVDGSHSLGAGALAEALMPFIEAAKAPVREAVGWRWGLAHVPRAAWDTTLDKQFAEMVEDQGFMIEPLYASPSPGE